MAKLTGKVAVVTGASKGIGAAIAKALGKEGASVVVNYASDKAGAERVAGEIVAHGGKALAVQGDVAKSSDVERIFAEAKQVFGRLDVLVNNAGVYQFTSLEQISEQEFHRQFNTNVWGLLQASREAVKHFDGNGGSIVNIGSLVTEVAPPASSIYTATKGAVDAITRVLANELGSRKIRVNSINPGLVETDGTHTAGFIGSDFHKEHEKQVPLGRIGQPGDIATIAAFLASDDAGWLSGQLLIASGGLQ